MSDQNLREVGSNEYGRVFLEKGGDLAVFFTRQATGDVPRADEMQSGLLIMERGDHCASLGRPWRNALEVRSIREAVDALDSSHFPGWKRWRESRRGIHDRELPADMTAKVYMSNGIVLPMRISGRDTDADVVIELSGPIAA